MSGSPEKGPNPYNAYAAYMVAVLGSAAASAIIVLIALNKLNQITDSGMWAITVMSLAPAVLGICVSFFIHRTAGRSQDEAVPHKPLQPTTAPQGSFREGRPFEGGG